MTKRQMQETATIVPKGIALKRIPKCEKADLAEQGERIGIGVDLEA